MHSLLNRATVVSDRKLQFHKGKPQNCEVAKSGYWREDAVDKAAVVLSWKTSAVSIPGDVLHNINKVSNQSVNVYPRRVMRTVSEHPHPVADYYLQLSHSSFVYRLSRTVMWTNCYRRGKVTTYCILVWSSYWNWQNWWTIQTKYKHK